MHTHTIVKIMVVAFSNRLNHIFISGMVDPCFSFKRLKLYWMQDILFTNDIHMDLFLVLNQANNFRYISWRNRFLLLNCCIESKCYIYLTAISSIAFTYLFCNLLMSFHRRNSQLDSNVPQSFLHLTDDYPKKI